MKLELALVSACGKTGCSVILLANNSDIKVFYSSLVQERIKIQKDHLVAINMAANPPQIVWRWIRAAVIELGADIIVVGDMHGHSGQVSLAPELPLELSLDDEVWACGTGSAYEIHDIIPDGKPAHPDRLLKYITPIIEGIYRQ